MVSPICTAALFSVIVCSDLQHMRKILLIIGAVAFAPVVYWMGAYTFLMIIGYHPDAIGIELAPLLVERGKGVEECTQIIHPIPHPFSPSAREQQASCIHRYASLKKDPSACNLLMPSDYGWSCLGAAEEPNQRWCWFDFGKDPAIVGRGAISIAMTECKNNPYSMRDNRCCELATALYINHEQHCKAFEQGPQQLHDQCLELLANRERNMNYCSFITSANVKAACEVSSRALEADGTDTVEKK